MEQEIGVINHWYDRIGVATMRLLSSVSIGDTIRVKRRNEEFEETVSSLQLDHQDIPMGKRGQNIGIHLMHRAHEGAHVYKVLDARI